MKEKIKNVVGIFCTFGPVPIFVWKQEKKFTLLSKYLYNAEMHGRQQHIHPIAI